MGLLILLACAVLGFLRAPEWTPLIPFAIINAFTFFSLRHLQPPARPAWPMLLLADVPWLVVGYIVFFGIQVLFR